MKKNNIVRKSMFYFIGNLSSKIVSSMLVPLYAFYISVEDLGYYDYSQTIMNILVPFAFLAIWEAILKFVLSEQDINTRNKYIATSSVFTIVSSLLISICIYLFNFIFNSNISYIGYINLMIIVSAISQIWQYYARALNKNKIYVYTGILGAVLNFLLVIVLMVILDMKLEGLYISYIISNLCIFLILEYKIQIFKIIKIKNISLKYLVIMLKYSVPLVFNLTSMWLITGFGRFIITNRLGSEINGLYAFANKFSVIVNMFGAVINMAVIEEAILSVNENELGKKFKNIVENLFKMFQSAIIIALPVIMIFYFFIRNTGYFISYTYVYWLLIYAVTMTMSTNIGSIFQSTNKTNYLFGTTIIGGLVTIIISYCFINKIGIYSVLIAQNAGALAMLFARYFFAKRFINFKINWKPIVLMLILYIFSSFIYSKSVLIISFTYSIVSIIVLYFINKEQIDFLIKKFWVKFGKQI